MGSIDRRQFLTVLGGTFASTLAGGCGHPPPLAVPSFKLTLVKPDNKPGTTFGDSTQRGTRGARPLKPFGRRENAPGPVIVSFYKAGTLEHVLSRILSSKAVDEGTFQYGAQFHELPPAGKNLLKCVLHPNKYGVDGVVTSENVAIQ